MKRSRALLVMLGAALACANDPAAAPQRGISESTTSVAQLPRPPVIVEGTPINCPHLQKGLTDWNAQWIDAAGNARVPAGTRALVVGNRSIPSSLHVRSLFIPADSELIFDDSEATFRVGDIRVEGAMRIGSPTCRLKAPLTFIFDGGEEIKDPAVRQVVYDRMGLGIVVEPGGALDVFGRLQQPTWTRLAQTASAGATQIQLAEAVDWMPGQKVVVVTSEPRDYPFIDQNEVRTITSVVDRTVFLDAPLAYRHYGGPEYQVEVGLLSRSIAFRTAADTELRAPGFGGHVLIHAAQARVSGVELEGFGQQNFLGRYPLHLHHAGDVAGQSYFTDNSIWRSNWRCAVLHQTSNAVVSRNVAFDVYGHCYYLEDGVETGNEISYNLAARTKIMGPTDDASLEALINAGQDGFTLQGGKVLANPADRAAAGFYITNGNNRIFGNAASGGFAGYSFPNLQAPMGGANGAPPLNFAISGFDGNSAHTAGYLWREGGGCVYVGGLFRVVDVDGLSVLEYKSGRPHAWEELRHELDTFSNTKTFLCNVGLVHWGNRPRVVNMESWDNELLAKVFGSASIRSTVVAGRSGNTDFLGSAPLNWFRRGFQFYDTRNQTILREVVFRDFKVDRFPGARKSANNCAIFSMTHSDEFTPQRMNASSQLYFSGVDDAVRICHDDTGTLSSRNFNWFDEDGTATKGAVKGSGARLVGSAYTDIWRLSDKCSRNDVWGAWVCPRTREDVAAVNTVPSAGVRVAMYNLDGLILGENWYSATSYLDAQITGPSGTGWHHSFAGALPEQFEIQAIQVPDESFVLYSFTLPPGASCSIAGWTPSATLASLLSSTGATYATEQRTCFIRIPPTLVGFFEAEGLVVPNQTWRGNPTPTTYFTVVTGCVGANCLGINSAVPQMPRRRGR